MSQKEPSLLGEYVFLKDFDERTSYHFIEFADRIVIYSVSGEISAFDIVTGEKIYEFFLGDINEMQAFDLVKTNEKEGFDYRDHRLFRNGFDECYEHSKSLG